jgi:hypothetical protein
VGCENIPLSDTNNEEKAMFTIGANPPPNPPPEDEREEGVDYKHPWCIVNFFGGEMQGPAKGGGGYDDDPSGSATRAYKYAIKLESRASVNCYGVIFKLLQQIVKYSDKASKTAVWYATKVQFNGCFEVMTDHLLPNLVMNPSLKYENCTSLNIPYDTDSIPPYIGEIDQAVESIRSILNEYSGGDA